MRVGIGLSCPIQSVGHLRKIYPQGKRGGMKQTFQNCDFPEFHALGFSLADIIHYFQIIMNKDFQYL